MNSNVYGDNLRRIRQNALKGQLATTTEGIEVDSAGIVSDIAAAGDLSNVNAVDDGKTNTTDNAFYRVLGTEQEVAQNVAKGFLNIFEGIIDFGAGIVGTIGEALDIDVQGITDFIDYDISQTIVDVAEYITPQQLVYKAHTGNWEFGNSSVAQESYIQELDNKTQEIITGVSQGVGQALSFIVTAGIGNAIAGVGTAANVISTALYATGAGGNSLREALDSGATYGQALAYGAISGTSEAIIERLSASLGVGRYAGELVKKVGGITWGELAKTFVAEGLEEVFSDVLDPFIRAATYEQGTNPFDSFSVSEDTDVNLESLAQTFLIGGLTGSIMEGTGTLVNTISKSSDGVALQRNMVESQQKYDDAFKEFGNAQNKFARGRITEQELNSEFERFNAIKQETAEAYSEYGQRFKNLAQKYQIRLRMNQDTFTEAQNYYNSNTYKLINADLENNFKRIYGDNINFNYDENINGAQFDSATNTITINPTATITQQVNAILHETGHAFKNSYNEQFNEFQNEVIETLKEDGSYETEFDKIYETYKEKIAKELNTTEKNSKEVIDYVNEELASDYIKNFATTYQNGKSIKQASSILKKRNLAEKLIDTIRTLMNNSRSEKLRVKYRQMIENIEKLQGTPSNKVTTKYSLNNAQTTNVNNNTTTTTTSTSTTTTTNIKDVDSLVEELNKLAKAKYRNAKVTFTATNKKVRKEVLSILNNMTTYNQNEIDILIEKMAKFIKINNMSINAYVKSVGNALLITNKSVITTSEFIDAIKVKANQIISEQYKNNKSLSGVENAKLITNAIYQTINSFKKTIEKQGKLIWKLKNLKNYFGEVYKNNKKYSNSRIESTFQKTFNEIQKEGIFNTNNIKGSIRSIITNDLVNDFYNAKLWKDVAEKIASGKATGGMEAAYEYKKEHENTINLEIEYIMEQERLNPPFTNANGVTSIPKINTEKPISVPDTNKYAPLNGKTEGNIIFDILYNVKRTIKLYNGQTGYLDGSEVSIEQVMKDEAEIQTHAKRANGLIGKLSTPLKSYIYSVIDPTSYYNTMANNDEDSFFNKMVGNLVEARDKTYQINRDLMTPLSNFAEDNQNQINKLSKKVEYKGREITTGEAISMRLASETDNAFSHFMGDGVKFERDQVGETINITGQDMLDVLTQAERDIINSKTTKRAERNELLQKAFDLSMKELDSVIPTEYNELMDIIRDLYKRSGSYYEEASVQINGYSFALKQIMYPLFGNRLAFDSNVQNAGQLTNNISNQMNPSFSKATVKGAKTSIVISDVLQTAVNFTNTLATYAGVTVEVNNLEKFLNKKVDIDGLGRKQSMYEFMSDNVDTKFKERTQDLFLAMQGIVKQSNSVVSKALRVVRSQSAKYNLGANAKVVLSQFMSYPMAGIYIKANNLSKALFVSPKGGKVTSYDYVLENSNYAYNREVGNNIVNADSVGAIGNINKVSELTLKPIKMADRATLTKIWYACQLETNYDLNAALELFEEVVQATQPQYDPLNNGSITRTDSEIIKGTIMYTSVVRKYVSRIYDAVYTLSVANKNSNQYKEAKKNLARTAASFMTASTLMTLLTSLLKAIKGDYDDEEKDEILVDILWTNGFEANIIGMFPIIRQIENFFANGYEIDVVGVRELNDLLNVLKNDVPTIFNEASTGTERSAAIWSFAQVVAKAFGIPIKNIYTDLSYLANALDNVANTDIMLKMNNVFYNTSNSALTTLANHYKDKGNDNALEEVFNIKSDRAFGESDDEVSKELAKLYKSTDIMLSPKTIGDTISINGEAVKLTKTIQKNMKQVASMANDDIKEMLDSYAYNSLSDEEKVKAIQRIYDIYYDLAKADYLGTSNSKLSLVASHLSVAKYVPYLAKISSISATEDKTRKALVTTYINRIGMTKAEKYLVFSLAGYKITGDNRKLVNSYLTRKGFSKDEIIEIIGENE